jgi:glucose/arabinose dehydrogenase
MARGYLHPVLALAIISLAGPGCSSNNSDTSNGAGAHATQNGVARTSCTLVDSGSGPTGTAPVHAEKMVTGLETPWSLVFLPGGDQLVTERPGRVRLIQNGALAGQPVLTVSTDTAEGSERGLLGMALDPGFVQNSFFYIYYTAIENSQDVDRIERYTLAANHQSATFSKRILDGINSGNVHNGGRIKFGPDGMLYVGTGDPLSTLSQNLNSPNGKILRIAPDGSIPAGNPTAGNPVYISGERNVEAFDFLNSSVMVIADNGPTGEINGWTGHDRVQFGSAGDNFGWPGIYGCETGANYASTSLSWVDAVPPGGALFYTGSQIPEWTGSVLIGATGAEHLHRVVFQTNPYGVTSHEVYFQGTYGRLRDVVQGPDGNVYVTTTNCDSRGTCPSDGDYILKISHD